MSYPDVELALLDYLTDLAYAVTSTPLDLQEVLPVLLVQRVGGGDEWENDVDYPLLLVTAFAHKDATTPRAGWELAEAIRDRLNALNGGGLYIASQQALLQSCATVHGPVEIPYLDATIGVFQATYRVAVKARS